jgi:hypothetical protein
MSYGMQIMQVIYIYCMHEKKHKLNSTTSNTHTVIAILLDDIISDHY